MHRPSANRLGRQLSLRSLAKRMISKDVRYAIHATRTVATRDQLSLGYPLASSLRAWRHGFTVEHAMLYGLDRRDPREYLSDEARLYRCSRINPLPQVFDQKLLLRQLLRDLDVAQPEVVALVTQFGVQLDPLGTRGQYLTPAVFAEWLAADGGRFIVKPQNGMYGRGIGLVELDSGVLVVRQGHHTRPFRPGSDLPPNSLVERRAGQHAFWESLSPASVNTLRILTLWTPGDDEPFVARAIQRIGTRETLPTDNWDGGGLLAPVNLESGRLGFGRINRFRTKREDRPYSHHPDTDVQIEGAVLPGWKDILATTLRVTRELPAAYYVGWDVAVAEDGRPLFIEGNKNTGIRSLQLDAGLLADPRIRRFYEVTGVVR